MSVNAEFAAWLGSACLNAVAKSGELETAWGELAATAEVVTALANKADAETEAARQLSLFGAPLIVETLQIAGLRVDLVCKPVRLTASRAGYTEGASVFVLGAKELENVERTNLTVLRKLA